MLFLIQGAVTHAPAFVKGDCNCLLYAQFVASSLCVAVCCQNQRPRYEPLPKPLTSQNQFALCARLLGCSIPFRLWVLDFSSSPLLPLPPGHPPPTTNKNNRYRPHMPPTSGAPGPHRGPPQMHPRTFFRLRLSMRGQKMSVLSSGLDRLGNWTHAS